MKDREARRGDRDHSDVSTAEGAMPARPAREGASHWPVPEPRLGGGEWLRREELSGRADREGVALEVERVRLDGSREALLEHGREKLDAKGGLPEQEEERAGDGAVTALAGPARESFGIAIEPDDPVSSLMSSPVAWVVPEMSLVELAATLEHEAVGAVPVLSAHQLAGVVSERDVVRALAGGGDPGEIWAADVMAELPLYLAPDEPVIEAAERMLDAGVRHLPVVSEGSVLGVVSARDALAVLTEAWRRSPTARARAAGEEV